MTDASIPFGVAARPTAIARPGQPSWPRLVAIQFGLIVRSGRWIELIGGIAVLFGFMMLLTRDNSSPLFRASNVQSLWMVLVMILVSAWPTLLWRGESPRARRYHWSLPVPHGSHDLARVAAGGLWVLIVAGLVGVVSHLLLPATTLFVAGDPRGGLTWKVLVLIPEGLTRNMGGYALGLVTTYSLASIPAVVVAKPARWFFGVVLATTLICAWVAGDNAGRLRNIIASVMFGSDGFYSATAVPSIANGILVFDFVEHGQSPILYDDAKYFRGRQAAPQLYDSLRRDAEISILGKFGLTDRHPDTLTDLYLSAQAIQDYPIRPLLTPNAETVTAFNMRFERGSFFSVFFNRAVALASAIWLIPAIALLLLISVSRHEL